MGMHWLKRPLHSSWLVAAVASSIIIGIVAAPYLRFDWVVSFNWLVLGMTLALLAISRQRTGMILLAVIGGMLIGLWRGTIELDARSGYGQYHGSKVILQGTVNEDTDVSKSGDTVIRLSNVRINEEPLPGLVWVTLSGNESVKRSNEVILSGTLSKGFGTFAAKMSRAKLVNANQGNDVALGIRDKFADTIKTSIPEPQSSLGIGFLLGQRRSLPEDLDTALQAAGLTHIVVASGYNLMILVRLSRRMFEKVSKYLSVAFSGSLIAGFIAITGMSPSMSRAGLVAGLSLAAWYYGRTFHPLVLIPLAAAITTLLNPAYLWGDVGWQLSFAAFAGVLLLAPLLQTFYFSKKKPGIVRQILIETISATIMTAPIILFAFGQISNVAVFANVLILPFVPIAMLLIFVTGLIAFIATPLAVVFGFIPNLVLTYMTNVTYYFAGLSWAKSEFEITIEHVIVTYLLLASFMAFMTWRTKMDFREHNIVE